VAAVDVEAIYTFLLSKGYMPTLSNPDKNFVID